jgi:hypothetical protein
VIYYSCLLRQARLKRQASGMMVKTDCRETDNLENSNNERHNCHGIQNLPAPFYHERSHLVKYGGRRNSTPSDKLFALGVRK